MYGLIRFSSLALTTSGFPLSAVPSSAVSLYSAIQAATCSAQHSVYFSVTVTWYQHHGSTAVLAQHCDTRHLPACRDDKNQNKQRNSVSVVLLESAGGGVRSVQKNEPQKQRCACGLFLPLARAFDFVVHGNQMKPVPTSSGLERSEAVRLVSWHLSTKPRRCANNDFKPSS